MEAPSYEQQRPDRSANGRCLQLVVGAYLEGRVSWADGRAVPCARVRIFTGSQAPVEVLAVQGRFSVHDLPPGQCRVEVVVGRSVVARRIVVPFDGGAFMQIRLEPARRPSRPTRAGR